MGDLRRDDYDVWAVEVAMETLLASNQTDSQ